MRLSLSNCPPRMMVPVFRSMLPPSFTRLAIGIQNE